MDTGTGRRVGAVLALVSAAVVVAVAVAVFVGLPGDAPPAQASAGPTASAGPATDLGVKIEYRVLPFHGVVPGPDDLGMVAEVLRARLDATGVAASAVTPSGADRVLVDVAVDPTDEAVVFELRALLGATGRLDFVPLGATPIAEGLVIDLEQFPPLFSGDQVMDAAAGSDQTGQRTVDFTLTPEGALLFADYTANHVGEYFAIALDGRAISVPVINSAIPDGKVQISSGGIGGFVEGEAQRLVAILGSGALPFPVEEIGVSR